MADKAILEISNKDQVAVDMAATILISMEKKNWGQITRQDYLRTVVQCADALRGINPTE